MNQSEPILTLPPGTQIGEYAITKVLGMGGFGITYLARDRHLDKDVAIKEYFPAQVAYRDAGMSVQARTAVGTRADIYQWGLERVMDEARVLAKFDHPNLVRVLRYFESHGTAYIVMDFVAGECLRDVITKRGPVAPATAKTWLASLLSGLAEVHGAGILHRDIKPPNIIIKADGTPVLIDFGAARQAMGSRAQDVTIVQSIRYTPIEQLSSNGTLGPWTDIYALAATMYEALTGNQPFDCSERIISDRHVPLVQAVSNPAESGFLAAVDWGLAVRPDDRPQSVAAWRDALLREHTRLYSAPGPESEATRIVPRAAELLPEPRPSIPPEPQRDSAPPTKRRRGLMVGALATVTLIAAVGAGTWWSMAGDRTRPATVEGPPPASAERNLATSAAPPAMADAPADAEPANHQDAPDTPPPQSPGPQETADLAIAEYVGYAEAYELFLRLYPDGYHAAQAQLEAERTPRMAEP